jgi:predicted HAD superfamily Cof-like phosphohydrolase
MNNVLDFHLKYGLPANTVPGVDAVPVELARLRGALSNEENQELQIALVRDRIIDIADALADIVYVAYGTALTYGIDLDAVLAEVHRSNMTKSPPATPGGKAVKGAAYEPPDVERVLLEQGRIGG